MADLTVAAETCVALGATEHQFESFPGRDIALGALTVTRVLPVKGKRLVGPWCFLDRFGPLTFADPSPMDVGAHPHMGLQTVTWLLDGELVHYDSLGYESLLRPGGVNVMTSGAAIAHAERTPAKNSGRLSGVQLWVALPDRDRQHVGAVSARRARARRRAARRNRSGVCGKPQRPALTGDASFRDLRRRCPGASGSRPRCAVGRSVRIRRACLEWGLQPRRAAAAGASAVLPWRPTVPRCVSPAGRVADSC